MKQRKAKVEISMDRKGHWPLSTFGSKKPFLYWSHILFEKDTAGELNGWTLIVELVEAPDLSAESVEATIYFMSPDAPLLHLFAPGAKFQLLCGQSHYGHGVVKRVLDDNSDRPPSGNPASFFS